MKLWVNKQGTVIPARAGGSAFLCDLGLLCGESSLRGSIFILAVMGHSPAPALDRSALRVPQGARIHPVALF